MIGKEKAGWISALTYTLGQISLCSLQPVQPYIVALGDSLRILMHAQKAWTGLFQRSCFRKSQEAYIKFYSISRGGKAPKEGDLLTPQPATSKAIVRMARASLGFWRLERGCRTEGRLAQHGQK